MISGKDLPAAAICGGNALRQYSRRSIIRRSIPLFFFRIPRRTEQPAIGIGIQQMLKCDLPDIVEADRLSAPLLHGRNHRKKHGRQRTDDGNNHQKFTQRKSFDTMLFHGQLFPVTRLRSRHLQRHFQKYVPWSFPHWI